MNLAEQKTLEEKVTEKLRAAGAKFAFVFGSRTQYQPASPNSDLDVAAWWDSNPPLPWDIDLPDKVDLVILNRAPLWLTGRVAMYGRVLFEDDPAARVAWQADTRFIYLDDHPFFLQRQREWEEHIASRDPHHGR